MRSSARSSGGASSRGIRTTNWSLAGILVTALLIAMSNIFFYHHIIPNGRLDNYNKLDLFRNGPPKIASSNDKQRIAPSDVVQTATPTDMERHDLQFYTAAEDPDDPQELSGLSCAKYGGPTDDIASQEMVYWSDIPPDSAYRSPFYDADKYITFEPDHGGWNNIRMSMETVLVLAHAMGRTLVLPPEQGVYLLGKKQDGHKHHFTFNDFFHLDRLSEEHDGLDIITMDEFLKRKGITGQLNHIQTGNVEMPPDDGRTDWNKRDPSPLWAYLRKVGVTPEGWNPNVCIAAIPASPSPNDEESLSRLMGEILAGKHGPIPDPENDIDYVGNPTPTNASTVERLKEMLANRSKLCIYNKELQAAPLLHFKQDRSEKTRLLTHFYAFVFFQDWRHDLWTKRFVRDHIRYVDEIMCAAARIVHAVRARARKNDSTRNNTKGEFDTFHVRRGDFQYKSTRIEASELYAKSRDQLVEGSTLYIATDERDKSFFTALKEHYDVTFLDDYMDLIKDVNPNYYGMLDQLVAYKGRGNK